MHKNGAFVIMVGLLVAGCTPKLDAGEVSEMLVKPTRGLIAGFDIGDSWDQIKASHDPRYTVRDDSSQQLRRDLSDPGTNGFFVDFGVDPSTKKITRISVQVYGDRPNAAAVDRVAQDFVAKFDAQFGKGSCDGTRDERAPGIDCKWGPDKSAPLASTHNFILKDYGSASLSVTIEPPKPTR